MAHDKPPSRLRRIAQLGGLTSRVTGKYVAERVKEMVSGSEVGKAAMERLHVDNAKDLADTMARLKGAAMKVGQNLALFADQLDLPPEVGKVLSRLHTEADPVPFETIREDVEKELGAPLDELFASFDPEPLGTASLAQAHPAQLPDGTDVVVKVLHRGVDDSVHTDLLALKGILISSRALRRSREEIDDVFAELKDQMTRELDYLQEAAHLHAFQQVFGDDPRVRIPTYHPSHSTERVLTLDRLPGIHIDAFLETATPEARAAAGRNMALAYFDQIFVHRMLHCDPHPGNYLFEPDGRVGILDFGAVKRFDEFWIGTYSRIALAMQTGDRDAAMQACIDLGAWDGKDPEAGEALWTFVRGLGNAFRRGEITLGAREEDLLDELRPAIEGLVKHPSIRAPRDVLMLHRSLGGLYALGRRLGTTMDFGAELTRHAEAALARAEGRA